MAFPDDAEAEAIIDRVERAHFDYHPIGFWYDQDFFLEMSRRTTSRTCSAPSARVSESPWRMRKAGRIAMMERFERWEDRGKQCVLLFCGDHEPAGLNISEFLKSNLAGLSDAASRQPVHRSVRAKPRLHEQNNGQVDLVVRQFADIAEDCDCAISLVHHTRKTPDGSSYAGKKLDDPLK